MSKPIPFAPGAIREFLVNAPDFVELVQSSSITTREMPDIISAPFVTIRVPGNIGVDPTLRKPLLVVNAWVPKLEILGGETDPDELAWNIAALAGQLMGRARNVKFRESVWSGTWKTGPIVPDPDVRRGPDNPLYRAFVTVEMKMREKPA